MILVVFFIEIILIQQLGIPKDFGLETEYEATRDPEVFRERENSEAGT